MQRLTIFQRSPQWVTPNALLGVEIAEPLRWLIAKVPLYRVWYRLQAGWRYRQDPPPLQMDPEWPHPARAVNAVNDPHRRFFTRFIESELDGRDDLVAKALPDYPPYGKRMLLDNDWFKTLRRDDVSLVTEPSQGITATGVETEDGADHEPTCWSRHRVPRQRFLSPMDSPAARASLREDWHDEDPRAHLGMTVPDYPTC